MILWLEISKYDGWALTGAWAAIGRNTSRGIWLMILWLVISKYDVWALTGAWVAIGRNTGTCKCSHQNFTFHLYQPICSLLDQITLTGQNLISANACYD